MITAQAASRKKGVRGAGVTWGLEGLLPGGVTESFDLRDELRCHGSTKPESLEGFEEQDMRPWLPSAPTHP